MYEYQKCKKSSKVACEKRKVKINEENAPIQRFIGFEFQFLESDVEFPRAVSVISDGSIEMVPDGISGSERNLEIRTRGVVNQERIPETVGAMQTIGQEFINVALAPGKTSVYNIFGNAIRINKRERNCAQPQINIDFDLLKLIPMYHTVMANAIHDRMYDGNCFKWNPEVNKGLIRETLVYTSWLQQNNMFLDTEFNKKFPSLCTRNDIKQMAFNYIAVILIQGHQDLNLPLDNSRFPKGTPSRQLTKDIPLLIKTAPSTIKNKIIESIHAGLAPGITANDPEKTFNEFLYSVISECLKNTETKTSENSAYRNILTPKNHANYNPKRFDLYDRELAPKKGVSTPDILLMELRRHPELHPNDWVSFALHSAALFSKLQDD